MFKQKHKEGGKLYFTDVSLINTKLGALRCAPTLGYALDFPLERGQAGYGG